MRIAIFTETFLPKWDGIANTLRYLLEHINKRGHTCLMFAPSGAPATYAGTPIIGLPSLALPLYKDLKVVPPLVNLSRELAAFRPDVVHLVNPALLGIVGMRNARDLGLPVVASYHTDIGTYAQAYGIGLFEDAIWAYFRRLHNRADLNLCPSRATQTELAAHGFKRLAVWGRGVDTVRFTPARRSAAWRARLTGGEPERQLLLYVGRLAVEKRVDWLRLLMHILPEACLAIVGDGPERPTLERRFAGTRTVFTGYLQGEDLANAYAAADLFAFPSDSETFGNVVLEAMASGLPVVAAGRGGPVDHIRGGYNGYLSDPDDPTDFAALAWRALSDEQALGNMRRCARSYAETQTWDRILDGLLDDYAQLARADRRLVVQQTVVGKWRARQRQAEPANVLSSR